MPIPTVQFPSAIDSAATLFAPFNVYKWKSFLKLACDASETVLTLTDGDDNLDIYSGVVNNYVAVDSEIMFCESIDNSGSLKTMTVIRGCGDSTAATHTVSGLLQQVITAEMHNQLVTAIIALENQVGVSPVSPIAVTLTPNSDDYQYTVTGHLGTLYDVVVAAKDSTGNNKSTTVHRVNHWNDVVQPPEVIDSFLFSKGSGVSSEIIGLVAGQETIIVRVLNCNAGEAKVTVKFVAEVE